MFDIESYDAHERVVMVNHAASGLKAIIAVHSTSLGPAAGGCRLWNYTSSTAAMKDALRLSKGMSYKNAWADVGLGGGKSVIIGPLDPERREDALYAFGEAVNELNGQYITAQDVGTSLKDLKEVVKATSYVAGVDNGKGGQAADLSPYTALGVSHGIRAVAKARLDRSDLNGVKVAVQGLGAVGGKLCTLLTEQGAELIVADINEQRTNEICDLHGCEKSSIDDILNADVDILAPCALGGIITNDLALTMRATAVAGGANNQLENSDVGYTLMKRGIFYAPDYVINAGGIIAGADSYRGSLVDASTREKVAKIYDRIELLARQSKELAKPTHIISDELAKEILSTKSNILEN